MSKLVSPSTNTNHTPGPWAQDEINGHKQTTILGVDGNAVAHAYWNNNGQWQANADLIVAAPDLLAALNELLYGTDSELDSQDRHVYRFTTAQLAKARAAIGKTKGGG